MSKQLMNRLHELMVFRGNMSKPVLFVTNDDGIEAPGIQSLIKELNSRGYPLFVLAPSKEQSATGMKISVRQKLRVVNRQDIADKLQSNIEIPLKMYSLDGSPCDTMIVSLDKGLRHIIPNIAPSLVVSGVNLGPNMSQDSYHSGTMGAAREAGLYGMPAIASSLTSFEEDGMEKAVDATVEVIEQSLKIIPEIPANLRRPSVDITASHLSRWPKFDAKKDWKDNPIEALKNAFFSGEMMLNINTPPDWDGQFSTTRLGMRWYRDAISFETTSHDEQTATFTIGAASIDHTPVENSDCDVVMERKSSISCLPNWPQTHPLALDDELLAWNLKNSDGKFPVWMN